MENITNIESVKKEFFLKKDEFFNKISDDESFRKVIVKNDFYIHYWDGDNFNFVYNFTFNDFDINIVYVNDNDVEYSFNGISIEKHYYKFKHLIDDLHKKGNISILQEYLEAIEKGKYDWVKETYRNLHNIENIFKKQRNDITDNIIRDFFDM